MIYIVLEGELEVVRTRRNVPLKTKTKDSNRGYIGPEK